MFNVEKRYGNKIIIIEVVGEKDRLAEKRQTTVHTYRHRDPQWKRDKR